MKKLGLFLLFSMSLIPIKVFARVNHYTDYVYENYLNGKKKNIPLTKIRDKIDAAEQKQVNNRQRLRYYDKLLKTDKEIQENLEVIKILEYDKKNSAEKLTEVRHSLQNINDEIEKTNKQREMLELEKQNRSKQVANTKNKDNKKDVGNKTDHYKPRFITLDNIYLQFGTGLSHLMPYKVSADNLVLQDNKTKNDEYNNSINLIFGYNYKQLDTEIEYIERSFLNNSFVNIDNNKMESYTQNLEMFSFGINAIYPLTLSQKLELLFGFGGGIATTYISGFGIAYMKDGKIVDKTVEPAAVLTKFNSEKEEKHNIPYISLKLSSAVLLNDNISLITSLKYNMFKDTKIDEGLYLQNLSSANLSVGIKYKFN